MNFLRHIAAFYYALLPVILIGFFASAIIYDATQIWEYVIAGVLYVLALLIGRFIFNFMRKRGVIATLSGDNATTDVDNLEPQEGDEFREIKPNEISALFHSNEPFINGGKIVIWGDWNGRYLNRNHTIESIDYESTSCTLIFNFKKGFQLTVQEPGRIFESSSYFKILKAKEITWKISKHHKRTEQEYIYVLQDNKIITSSNTSWKPHKYDLGVGELALYIQG